MCHKTLFVVVILISCYFATIQSEVKPKIEDTTTVAPPFSYSKVLTSKNYQNVLRSHRIVLIKFYAPWCKFSQRFVDIWEELAENYKRDKRILFADMNCVSEKVCFDVYGVTKYPSLYIFWNNEVYNGKYTGYRNVDDLTNYIEEAVSNITSTYN